MRQAPQSDSIHGIVDDWAARHPDRVAVTATDGDTSYAELRRRADALAGLLIDRGVRPESRVVLHLDRSVDLIVAMLGVLKAGAAYVPVSPAYPAARVRQLVEDSAPVLIISHDPMSLSAPVPVPVLRIDATGTGTATVAVATTGDSAAYVMYTSGSTGRPKGVVVTHGNAINLVRDQDYADFSESETFLQLAPTSFDASAFEIWGALLSGGRLVLAAASYQAIDRLPETLRSTGVTTLFLTPALFHELVRARMATFAGVRRVVVGGDVLAPDRADEFVAWAAGRPEQPALVNGYGPTETTTFATAHLVRGTEAGGVPIGRPLHGVRVYLLDELLRPVPTGAQGDIWIAGSGVTRGYLGQPGVTARAFLPDPFAPVPGSRMYRTGDRGRVSADGSLMFLGRADQQVKVHGHRIEPAEVELALLALPAVREAVVVAEPVDGGDKQLVAYVIPAGDDGITTTDVREQLSRTLPGYLIPARYVMVESLRRTPSGKLDRLAVRATPRDAPVAPAAPADDAQRILIEVWRAVLGVPEIGPDDDFFALGGDSMLAIRAITEAEARGLRVSLLTMFENPVLRAVSAAAGTGDEPGPAPASGPAGFAAEVVPVPQPLLPPGVEAVYPASRLQLGLIFEAMSSEDGSLYHDVMAHRIDAALDVTALATALAATTAAHDVLRTGFDLGHVDGPHQVVRHRVEVPLTIRDLRGLAPDRRDAALADLAAELGRPFDVSVAPLLRVAAAPVDNEQFFLVYGFHHAIMDGWSDTVFLDDLLTAYAAASSGAAPRLSRPATRYADFVRLEAETSASSPVAGYWQRRTAALTPTLVMPDPAHHGSSRQRVSRPVPAGLRASAESAAAELRVPLKSVVIAAHLGTLTALTGVDEPTTGLPINGRPEAPDADRMVGLFLNIIPMSAGSTAVSGAELAGRVFEAERAALEFRRFPYSAIRQLAGRPLFDVLCNFANFHLWRELTRDGHVAETRMWDRTSFPLVVDVVLDRDDGLRIDVTGDSAVFQRADLEKIWQLHVEALMAISTDPTARVDR